MVNQSQFQRRAYSTLNARQQENYNFQKIAAQFADYGFNCLRLSDDWQGADFIACHIDGVIFLKIQQKGRLTFNKKYTGKDIHIAFLIENDCYVYPHDEFLERLQKLDRCKSTFDTKSWIENGRYDWRQPPSWAIDVLNEYKL